MQVVVLVQWYGEPSAVRRRELEAALAGNVANRHVAAVVLLHGWADAGADPARVLSHTNTTHPSLHPPPPHLRAAYQGTRAPRHPGRQGRSSHGRRGTGTGHARRLSMADVVAHTNALYAGKTVVFANTDMLLDHSLRCRGPQGGRAKPACPGV
jgi:hypothetical protein